MKNLVFLGLLICFLISSQQVTAQKSHGTLYNPTADAHLDISGLLKQARKDNKHVLLQVGGNWCGWCYKFQDFVQQDTTIKTILDHHYLIYHLNYSKENKNEALMKQYEFPQRMGFPVFVILDVDGRRIHTQDSSMLESGDGYDEKKVANFFNSWTAMAIDPMTYDSED